jgi:hypothetical protein
MVKKIFLGFILGITISTTTTVFASDTIQAYLFPIKKTLGQPKNEGFNDTDNTWYLYYEAGDYQVFFNTESEKGQIRSLTLKKNK